MTKTPNSRFDAFASLKLATVLILIFSANVTAQVSFGVKAGLNLNYLSVNVEGQSNVNKSALTPGLGFGSQIGGLIAIPMSQKVFFKPGLSFVGRGAGLSDERIHIYYADLPLLFQLSVTKNFYVEAGPVASRLLGAYRYSTFERKLVNISTIVESYSVGLSCGVGYFVKPRLAVTASFYRAMTEAWDIPFRDEDNQPVGTVDFFPANVSFGVEYHFRK